MHDPPVRQCQVGDEDAIPGEFFLSRELLNASVLCIVPPSRHRFSVPPIKDRDELFSVSEALAGVFTETAIKVLDVGLHLTERLLEFCFRSFPNLELGNHSEQFQLLFEGRVEAGNCRAATLRGQSRPQIYRTVEATSVTLPLMAMSGHPARVY